MWCYSGALCCNVIESVTSSRHLLTKWTKIPRCRGLKMKAGYLLWRQAYFWFRDWNEKRAETRREKKSLRGFWKDDITDLTALEVLDLSVLFVMIEHSVLLGVESKLKSEFYTLVKAAWLSSSKVCHEGFTLCPSFSSARRRNLMQRCGKQHRAVG